jgi:hypothetical protein
MLALLGGIGGRREHEGCSQGGGEDFKWKRHGDHLTIAWITIRLANGGSSEK